MNEQLNETNETAPGQPAMHAEPLAAADESFLASLAMAEAPPADLGHGMMPAGKSQQEITREYETLINAIIAPAFQIVCPGWGVQKEETDVLAEAWAAVAFQMYPNGVESSPLLAACVTTAIVIAPRVVAGKPRKLPAPADRPEPESKGAEVTTTDTEQPEKKQPFKTTADKPQPKKPKAKTKPAAKP